jgi:Family of unknown function (DUF6502)
VRRASHPQRSTTVSHRGPGELDADTKEAIRRFVRLLARCGTAPGSIARQVAAECRAVPKSWATRSNAALPYLHHTSHVLTLWFSDPKLLGPDGQPYPLPVRGGERCIAALVRQVDPGLDVDDVVRFLVRAKVLHRIGSRYVPHERSVVLRGSDAADSFRKLRGLLGMLRAFEHNQTSKRQSPGWFEAFADNPSFPVRALPALDRLVRAECEKLLVHFDSRMHREERLRDPDEPTVRVALGVYRFEEPVPSRRRPRKG